MGCSVSLILARKCSVIDLTPYAKSKSLSLWKRPVPWSGAGGMFGYAACADVSEASKVLLAAAGTEGIWLSYYVD